MAPRQSLDERLRRVESLRNEADLDIVRDALKKALTDSSNLVAAAAARIISELELSGFEADLLKAWGRFLVDPVKSDKGCRAKSAIVEALGRTGFDDADFWLAGMNYKQVEPLWPQPEDTAVELRGGCAFGLARSRMLGPVKKLVALVDLLHSSSEADRIHAVRAVAETASDSAIPLLKSKLLGGDVAGVQGACFSGLLSLAPAEFLPLVVKSLRHPADDIHVEACAALGESGLPGAVDALIATAKQPQSTERLGTILLSLGLSRSTTAVDYLVTRVQADGVDALTAFHALRPACVHADVRKRVLEAAKDSSNARLIAAAKVLRSHPGE